MRSLPLFFFLGMVCLEAQVTWTPIGPRGINGKTPILESGKVQALAVFASDARVMYVGGGVGSGSEGPPAQAGVFKTTDGGAHWTAMNRGLTDPIVNALWVDASNQNLVLAGTEVGGIFRSTDGGATWTRVGTYGPVSDFLTVSGKLLAAAGPGILSSADGGATWTSVTATAAPVRVLAAAGAVTAAGTDDGTVLWQAGPGGPFQTVYQAPGPPPVWIWSLAVNPAATNNAYIVVGHGNSPSVLMATGNAGSAWTPVVVGAAPQAVAFAPAIGTTFVAGADGLWTSTEGRSWRVLPFGRWDSRRIYWNDSQKVLYLGTDQGLHTSTDSGATFTSLTGTLSNSIITGLAVKGTKILAGMHDFDPTVSFDGGSTWAQPSYRNGGFPGGEDGPVVLSGSYCYVDSAAGFQYSTDGCQTFHPSPAPQLRGLTLVRPGSVNAVAVSPSDPSQVFVATTAGVAKSTDSGVTMTPTPWPLGGATAIAVHPRDPKTILIGTTGGLFRTADGGSTWTPTATPGPGFVTTLAFNPADPSIVLAGMSQAQRGGAGVLRSTDGGVTFRASNKGLPSTLEATPCCGWDVLSIRFSPEGLAALGMRTGAYLSNDLGQTWQNITANSTATYFSDVAWDGGFLYAGTYGGGVMRATLAATSIAATPVSLTFAAGGAAQSVTVTSSPTGAAFTASATDGGAGWLTVSPASGTAPGSIAVAVNAAGLAPGNYTGTVTVTSPATLSPATIAVQLTVAGTAPLPAVVVTEVVNGASYLAGISPGSWVVIRGTGLSDTTRSWSADDFVDGQLPTQLDGVGATIGGTAAAVNYISPTQLNVLAPADVPAGSMPVVVKNAKGTSVAVTAAVAAAAPALFLIAPQTPAATHLDGSLVGPPELFPGASTPAQPGEAIILYGTGFGAAPDASNVTVEIGGVTAQVTFAGNTGAGLCQINLVVPSVPDGNATLTVHAGAIAGPAATIAVKR